MAHIPVLLNESINFLEPERGRAFLDATANGGGHAKEILKRMTDKAILVAVDRDEDALTNLKKMLGGDKRLKIVCGNFRSLRKIASKFSKKYDGMLFDLGMSTNQLEGSGRGFSFLKDEPLLMTFEAKPAPGQLTASIIVNTWTDGQMAEIFWKYGEERYARKISKAIVEERRRSRILSSKQLADIVALHVSKKGRLHPATKIFQALRIAVNDELPALEEGLSEAWSMLTSGGRLVVISFHSLEDRVVKNFFRNKKTENLAKVLTKKPIAPSAGEVSRNPASRSAKLRTLVKIND